MDHRDVGRTGLSTTRQPSGLFAINIRDHSRWLGGIEWCENADNLRTKPVTENVTTKLLGVAFILSPALRRLYGVLENL